MSKLSRYLIVSLTITFALCLAACTAVQTGWLQEDGKNFYADSNGELVTGWQEIDGKRYFFGEDHGLVTGWLKDDGSTYYMDITGAMVTGWQEIDGKRCFFDSTGRMVTGWLKQGEDTLYLLDDGTPLSGWLSDEGQRYYFREDGVMCVGWNEADGALRYFHDDGALASGVLELDTGRYLLDQEGVPYTGWLEEDGKRYYYGSDGAMTVGKAEIDGKTYYFSPHGVHVLLVNPWNYVPEDYEVELATVEHYQIAAQCSDALAQMLADCRAAGFDPALCSTYRTQADQEFLYERKVTRVMAQGYDEAEARVIAATEVAIPGTSEHQLGLAADIVDNANWSLDETQAQMPTQLWLMEHCWEYGFILRYPVGSTEITGIIYEPWHYRYVGVEISMEMRDLGITLEEYLGAVE